MNASEKAVLQIPDYIIIVLMLVVPLAIGIFFAVRDSKRATRDEYLLGGRKMSVLPVLLSLFATFQSAISLLGIPSEVYLHGPVIFAFMVGVCISYFVGAFTVTPLLYPLKLTSTYEYVERRFDSKCVRLLSVILGSLQTFSYMCVVLLAPGLALEAAAGIPFWISVVIVGTTGTIYTCAGGIKSVLWTDVFQTIVVFTGIFVIIIKSCTDIGGIDKTWKLAEAGGRTRFDSSGRDPRVRHTWLSLMLSGYFIWMSQFFGQATVQRICGMKSLRGARLAMIINGPLNAFYSFTLIVFGWCMYSYFAHIECDPLEAGLITNSNQTPLFFVLHAMRELPGISGLYLSTIFSGALSTLSSGINALAANTIEDILKKPLKSVSEKRATTITKIVAFFYGMAVIATVYAFKSVKGNVIELSLITAGTFGSIIHGLFLLACCVPWANKYGAICGAVVALILNVWMVLGHKLYGRQTIPLNPVTTEQCFNSTSSTYSPLVSTLGKNNYTTVVTTGRLTNDKNHLPDTFSIYDISYEWYAVLGTCICFSVGVITSLITKHRVKHKTDPKLILGILRRFWNLPDPVINENCETVTDHSVKEVSEAHIELLGHGGKSTVPV